MLAKEHCAKMFYYVIVIKYFCLKFKKALTNRKIRGIMCTINHKGGLAMTFNKFFYYFYYFFKGCPTFVNSES